jgi:Bacterial Ig domain
MLVIAALMGCSDDAASPISPPKGNAPILAFQSDTTIAYADTLRLNASATDPDGDPLTFSMAVIVSLSEIRTGYFARAGMDASTGAFWFLPGPRDVPDRSFQFTVTDGTGLTDTSTFKVTVVVRSTAGTMMPESVARRVSVSRT